MYIKVKNKKIKKYFQLKSKKDVYLLRISNLTKPVKIRLPFKFDEDAAALAGLMPDGSLIRDLMRVFFIQKKSMALISLFDKIISRIFLSSVLLHRKIDGAGATQIYANSKTLAYFFYYILDISKSDEQMRVPSWVFESTSSVRKAYLRSAFDTEGSILKKLTEIRFVSKDKYFAKDIKRLLASVGIRSYITYTPRPTATSGQYRVSIYRKENFEKFRDIDFRVPFLRKRFRESLRKYNLSFPN